MSGLERRFEPRRLEVINGAGGRRVWSADAKATVLDEMPLPGAVVSVVARRHGLTPQQVFGWRRKARRALEMAAFSSPDHARRMLTDQVAVVGRGEDGAELAIQTPALGCQGGSGEIGDALCQDEHGLQPELQAPGHGVVAGLDDVGDVSGERWARQVWCAAAWPC